MFFLSEKQQRHPGYHDKFGRNFQISYTISKKNVFLTGMVGTEGTTIQYARKIEV